MANLRRGLILAYHGFMGSPRQFRERSQLDELAESIDFDIRFMRSTGGVWYWGGGSEWAKFMYQRQANEMCLAAMVHLEAHLPVVLVGFSAGGNMATRLARQYSWDVDALFAAGAEYRVTNWCLPVPDELPPAIFQGNTNDPHVPPLENGALLAPWWGHAARFHEGPEGHDRVWGGHCWLPEFNNPLLAELIARVTSTP